MHITMIKKQLENGDPCDKCAQTEAMLKRREMWDHIDDVIWVIEGDDASPGAIVARKHGVTVAPFFVIREDSGDEIVYTSAMKMLRDRFPAKPGKTPATNTTTKTEDLAAVATRLAESEPREILRWGLERYGEHSVIAFSGAEDVVLIDMAIRLELPFKTMILDTGRLHGETYELIDEVRRHYGIAIDIIMPEAERVQDLIQRRGANSFYQDGHLECCSIRKVEPLRRTLVGYDAWVTGQRRDQSPATRAGLAVVERDRIFEGRGKELAKLNPLAAWGWNEVWTYIHRNKVPHNPLQNHGYRSLGCQPCTRPSRADEPLREGRWWWERENEKECGIHVSGDGI